VNVKNGHSYVRSLLFVFERVHKQVKTRFYVKLNSIKSITNWQATVRSVLPRRLMLTRTFSSRSKMDDWVAVNSRTALRSPSVMSTAEPNKSVSDLAPSSYFFMQSNTFYKRRDKF